MDAVPQKRHKPSPQEVKRLQELYPKLDYLMCETLLWFSDEELQVFASKEVEGVEK